MLLTELELMRPQESLTPAFLSLVLIFWLAYLHRTRSVSDVQPVHGLQ